MTTTHMDPPGAIAVRCSQCWQLSEKPCWPYGTHLSRYEAAAKENLITEDELDTARAMTRDGIVWRAGWRK